MKNKYFSFIQTPYWVVTSFIYLIYRVGKWKGEQPPPGYLIDKLTHKPARCATVHSNKQTVGSLPKMRPVRHTDRISAICKSILVSRAHRTFWRPFHLAWEKVNLKLGMGPDQEQGR